MPEVRTSYLSQSQEDSEVGEVSGEGCSSRGSMDELRRWHMRMVIVLTEGQDEGTGP